MKINKLIDSLSHIEYNEKEIMRSIFNTINNLVGKEEINSIIYINNGIVKFFCTGENLCMSNVIIINNKAYDWCNYAIIYDWCNYTIINDTVFVNVPSGRIYTIDDYIPRLLDTLRETPIEYVPYDVYVKLYNKLRQGYKIKINVTDE